MIIIYAGVFKWAVPDKTTGRSIKYQYTRYDCRETGERVDGIVISFEMDFTVLNSRLVGPAALRGILNRIWDLNQTVIAVSRIFKEG